MENHPALGLGQLKGLEGRSQSKKLWFKLTRIVNTMNGPTRPMKSWVKVHSVIITYTVAIIYTKNNYISLNLEISKAIVIYKKIYQFKN